MVDVVPPECQKAGGAVYELHMGPPVDYDPQKSELVNGAATKGPIPFTAI